MTEHGFVRTEVKQGFLEIVVLCMFLMYNKLYKSVIFIIKYIKYQILIGEIVHDISWCIQVNIYPGYYVEMPCVSYEPIKQPDKHIVAIKVLQYSTSLQSSTRPHSPLYYAKIGTKLCYKKIMLQEKYNAKTKMFTDIITLNIFLNCI